MAPKPIRLTVRFSPSAVVPAAAAFVAVVFFNFWTPFTCVIDVVHLTG
jgi:hypothetical protein